MIWTCFALLIFGPLREQVLCDNYPNSDKIKPCSQKLNTIEYQGPVCVPTTGGAFEPGSESNCQVLLKGECPEFNQANCEWFNYTWNDKTMGSPCVFATGILFPACKLRYKAKSGLRDKTWMEVFYVNQLGTYANSTIGLYVIVEMHRYNYKYAKFGNVYQPDWPLSVPDPRSAAGILWDEQYPTGIQVPICVNGHDVKSLCSNQLREDTKSKISGELLATGNIIATCQKYVFNLDERKPVDVCWVKVLQVQDNYIYTNRECIYYYVNETRFVYGKCKLYNVKSVFP